MTLSQGDGSTQTVALQTSRLGPSDLIAVPAKYLQGDGLDQTVVLGYFGGMKTNTSDCLDILGVTPRYFGGTCQKTPQGDGFTQTVVLEILFLKSLQGDAFYRLKKCS